MLYELIKQTDSISKLILLSLLGMSLVCWTIGIYKVRRLMRAIPLMRQGVVRIDKIYTLEDLAHAGALLQQSALGTLTAAVLMTIKTVTGAEHKKILTLHEQELIGYHLDHAVRLCREREERYIGFIKLAAETGTLIGLFGTVYGLIHAFVRIGEQQSADIAAVAPGIAEALVTTLTGLFVAIPALVMYQVLMRQLESFEALLNEGADRLQWLVAWVFGRKE